MYKQVYVTEIGSREFLVIEWENSGGNEGGCSIPVDRIRSFDLNPPNGGCDNSVRIVTDDPDEDHVFAYDGADLIRKFLADHNLCGTSFAN